MPDYEVTYPDGRKFKMSAKKPLSQKEAEEAIAKHQATQVVTERQMGDVTERTIYAKVGSPGPKARPSKPATDFGEEEQPTQTQGYIDRLRAEIAADRAAPQKDLLDLAMEKSWEDRERIKKMPLRLPKILADIGISTRDLALSPLSIPRALGSKMDEAYDTTDGDQLAKTLAGLGAGAGGALDMATDFLPLMREGKQVARGEQPDILSALSNSFRESPVGTTLDLGGVAGGAAAGLGKVSRVLAKHTTPQVVLDPRARVAQASSPIIYKSMGGRARGAHNGPLFHHEPIEPGAGGVVGGRRPSGMSRGAAREEIDRKQLQRTFDIMDQELLGRLPDDPEKVMDALSRNRVAFGDLLDKIKSDPEFVADAFRAFEKAEENGQRPKFSVDPLVDLMLGRLYQDKLDLEIQKLETSLESLPPESVGAIRARAILARKLDTIMWTEAQMLRPTISAAGRTLAHNRWYLRDPGSFAAINQKWRQLTGEDLPELSRDRFYRYTTRIRKLQQKVDERLETQALNAEPRTKELLVAIQPFLTRQAHLEAGIAKLETHKKVLQDKIRGEAAKILEMGDGGAETITVEDAIRVVNEAKNRRGAVLPDPLTAAAVKVATAVQKAGEKRDLVKAVESADKEIAARKKEHLDLRSKIKAKLAETEQALANPTADLSAPLPPVNSTKGLTRNEISARKKAREEAKKAIVREKTERTTAARESAAKARQDKTLATLGDDRPTKSIIVPKVSAATLRRSQEIGRLDAMVRRGRNNLSDWIDDVDMDNAIESVKSTYEADGYAAARELWQKATEGARKEVIATRIEARKTKSIDSRLDEVGVVKPRKTTQTDDNLRRISRLNQTVAASKKQLVGRVPDDEFQVKVKEAVAAYRKDQSEAGLKEAQTIIRDWKSGYLDAKKRDALEARRIEREAKKAEADRAKAEVKAEKHAERERVRAEKNAAAATAKQTLEEIRADARLLKDDADVLAKHAAIPVKQAERADKATEASLRASQGVLDRLGFKPKAKPQHPLVNELARLRGQEVRSLDALAQRLQEKYGTVLSEDFIREAFQDSVRTYEEAIAAPLLPGEKGGSAYSLLKAKLELQEAFNTELMKKRGVGQRFVDGIGLLNDSMRSVMASMDLSYLGRQAGLAVLSRPSLALGKAGGNGYAGGFRTGGTAGVKSFQVGGTEKSLSYIHDVEMKIINAANSRYGNEKFYQDVGLDFNIPEPDFQNQWVSLLMDPKTQIFGQEEFRGGLAKRIPGLKQVIGASDRAFAAGINVMRQEMFDAMYNPKTMDVKGGTVDAQAIARMVNVTTGRGHFNRQWANQAMPAMAHVLFSPKYTSSRIEILGKHAMSLGGLNPLYDSFSTKAPVNSPVRKAIRAEQRRITRGLAAVYGAAWFVGLERGTDPTSTTFGMIKLPSGAWLDPLAGTKQILVPILRGYYEISRNLAGKARETDLREQTDRYGGSRLAPGLALGYSTNFGSRSPDRWKDYNDSPLVKDDTKTRWKVWLASDGVVPGSGTEKLAMWLAGAESLWMKSGLPLTATQMLEEFAYKAKQEGVSPEEAAWVLAHTALNASGIATMNYDMNRGAQNRRRGSSNPLSIPDPVRSLERQLSVPGM